MKLPTKLTASGLLHRYALVVPGCLVAALAYPLFLEPSHIAPGGLTGLTTILHFYFGWPIGLTSLALNLPLLILGWRMIGAGFVARTLVATMLFSVMIDLLRFPALSQDPLLSAVFGGVLLGAGHALILKGSATTGGTDLMARIVHHHQRSISIGTFLFGFDLLVVLLAWIFLSATHAMYAIICVFLSARVLDQVLNGFGQDKACYIISREHERIEGRLIRELERGVTRLPARGAFSDQNLTMLLCVVGRFEAVKVRAIVSEEDANAFMFVTDTHETLGEGFQNLLWEDV